jgi:polygalacturonase
MLLRVIVLLCASTLVATSGFRPESYGAKADGVTLDTRAVNQAAAACASAGAAGLGCELLFTSGKIYLTGPFLLPGQGVTTIEKGATVKAASMKQWHAASWGGSIISSKSDNVTLRGGGTIDGSGADWWHATHDDLHYRPGMMVLEDIDGLVIEDVLLLNSPNHNVFVSNCTGVRVQRLRVSAPHNSPNTDGINFAGGNDQSIVDSHISNGDDCVSIVPGPRTTAAPPRAGGGQIPFGGNVVVRNLTCDNGHGVSIGSIRHGMVVNVSVENVRFYNSDNGARIKTYPNHSGLVSGIIYKNISLKDVSNPILIDGEYCPKSQRPYPCPPGKVAVTIDNITFEDFTGTGKTAIVGNFDCSAVSPCNKIKLTRVQLASGKGGVAEIMCKSVKPLWTDSAPSKCTKPESERHPAGYGANKADAVRLDTSRGQWSHSHTV